jgi:hypothetical protein
MAERTYDFHFDAPDGIFWDQMEIFYESLGIERDIKGSRFAYPDIEYIESWHDDIPASKVVPLIKSLPNFGLRGKIILKDSKEDFKKAA